MSKRTIGVPVTKPLSLTNGGELEVVFLGVGSAFAASGLFQTSILIIKGQTHILVDFGRTGPEALAAVGVPLKAIRTLLPTHSHSDHVGGVESLALVNKFELRRKLNVIATSEYKEVLWDRTLRGGLEFNECQDTGKKLSFEDYFDVHKPTWKVDQPRQVFEIDYEGIHLELFRTLHHMADNLNVPNDSFLSYGLFIDNQVFFSGDTRFDPELIAMYGDRAAIMFHDVHLNGDNVLHAPLRKLLGLPEEVRRKMLLMHYSNSWLAERELVEREFAGFAKQAESYSPCGDAALSA